VTAFCVCLGVGVAVITGDPNAILAGVGFAAFAFGVQVLAEVLAWLGVKL